MDAKPFQVREIRAQEPGEHVHADVCGPMDLSLGGAKYFLLVKDEYSHYRHIYFLKAKSEATDNLMSYIRLVEQQHQVKIRIIRTDDGKEFVNKRFANFVPLKEMCVEREHRTVLNAVRTMLAEAQLTKAVWAEAATQQSMF